MEGSRYNWMLLLFLMFLQTCSAANDNTVQGYLGCFEDSSDRLLNKSLESSNSNTGEKCKQRCEREGFRYAGTEYRIECYCGNSFSHKTEVSGCNMTCPGNSMEYCGGDWRISLYDNWMSATSSMRTTQHTTSTRSTNKVTTATHHLTTTTSANKVSTTTTTTTTTTTSTTLTTSMQVTTAALITETESIYRHGISAQERSGDSSQGTVYISVSAVAILTLIAIVTIACWCKRRRSHRGDKISVSCQDVQADDTAETQMYENQQTSRHVERFEPGKQADLNITDYINENQTIAQRPDHNRQISAKLLNNIVEDNIYENQIASDPIPELGKKQPENNYEVLQSEGKLCDEYLTIDNVNQIQY
ncbi:uncharacterized protein LOC123551712 isoform X2 [Mercenaria mercenaria]|uniref:uncharacterized protein LOC123551712 isoform X2 n=1 Tax=Mercenaria mercenaria TaxID=6596 RepID=UPI00234F9793|nr:uncharacterized protein LOC123551712 isoform X2 [Mercenaria mercenaria]